VNSKRSTAPLSSHHLHLLSSRHCLFPCPLVWLVVEWLCCVLLLTLSCCIIPPRRHTTLCCAVLHHNPSSSQHDVSSSRCIVLSLCRAPLCISSHPLCLVGCCVVALRLVLASPRASCRRDLPLCCLLLLCCVLSLCLIISFGRQVWFSWLLRFLPSASHRTTSRQR
jgi:hypothetical protein